MSTARALLGILGGLACGYVIAVVITGLATPRGVGVAVAIIAASVIGIYLVKAIETDKRRELRRNREQVWQRRIRDGLAGARPALPNRFGDLKPWPIGDDEVRS